MEEASVLCDRIIILHNGKFVADDTPENLVKNLGFPRTIVLESKTNLNVSMFSDFNFREHEGKIYISSKESAHDLAVILEIIKDHGIELQNIKIHEANLEDVFMKLTNQTLTTENV